MYDVTALGEVLIDFTPCGVSATGQKLFEQNPGGAPANVLAALNNLGLKTAFIGKVGDDIQGSFLRETLLYAGIDCKGLIIDKNVFTTLAFVLLNEEGERSFSFARKPGADIMLTKEEVDIDIIKMSRLFHTGSLSLTDEPSKSATLYALRKAKENGCIISYDPNYRSSLWPCKETAIKEMRSIIPFADVMKLSDEETILLTDKESPEEAAAQLVENGVSIVAVTLGSKGAYVCTREGGLVVPGFPSKVVDTNGAGDSFWGGFLYQLIKSSKKPSEITLIRAKEFVRFGNATASLCVEKRGGIPAMPKYDDIINRLKNKA